MPKGSQNKDSEVAFEHAITSLGKYLKCNGIFHKGYPNGEKVHAENFKRMGKGYQAFCSECDQARQNAQKTLKRIAAIVMVDNTFRLKFSKEFKLQKDKINSKLERIVKESNSPLEVYTRLVEGKDKLTIKELGLYETKLSIKQKREFINALNNQTRNEKNDASIKKILLELGKSYKFKCSTCEEYYLVFDVQPNISQSRDVFDLDNKPTGYKLPLHNVCSNCMLGNRADSVRHFKFLCNGRFVEATRKMTEIGKKYYGMNIHADHIVPLRLGGKHDPINIRPLQGPENTKKRDKLTEEALTYLANNKIAFEKLLTDWYVPEFKKYFPSEIKKFNRQEAMFIEVILKKVVDAKRFNLMKLPLEKKMEELKNLYPQLSQKEVDRIIRKCFS